MAGSLRALTPLALVGLCLLVWFEDVVPGADALAETTVLRLVVGLLCLFALVQFLERQRLQALLEQLVARIKQAGTAAPARDREQVTRDAMAILIAALESSDADVRRNAVENLERMSGQKFGADPARWRALLARSAGGRDSESGLGASEDSA